MVHFETAIDIAATRDAVWGLLIDAPNYPAWNPTVVAIEGLIEPDERIGVTSAVDPGRVHHVTVVEYEPENRMVWRGGLPFGIFSGSRLFLLGDSSAGVRFEMSEHYGGFLAPVISRTIPNLQASFDDFAIALRDAAEALE